MTERLSEAELDALQVALGEALFSDDPLPAAVEALFAARLAPIEALAEEAKEQGVNDGVRLAAQLVRDHVLGDSGESVAKFLEGRADRAALAASRPAHPAGDEGRQG